MTFISFLLSTGLCALFFPVSAYTDQAKEGVSIESLSNGVKVCVEENTHPDHFGAFRVVVMNNGHEETLYSYDAAEDSLELVEEFFNSCKQGLISGRSAKGLKGLYGYSFLPKTWGECPEEVAVIAVGNFSAPEMQQLIAKHFGGIAVGKQTPSQNPIQVERGADAAKIALRISFPNPRQPLYTDTELREVWMGLLLQDLYQQRLERSSKCLSEEWVHPHPKFFYPVHGYALVSEETSENLLTFLLWQIEMMRKGGFSEEEFLFAKRAILNRLQFLSSSAALPSNSFLASYYADQFLLDGQWFDYSAFLDASTALLEGMECADLYPHIEAFFSESGRSIQVVYPETAHAQELTSERIGVMIQNISELASSCKKNEASQVPEEVEPVEPQSEWLVRLVDHRGAGDFCLANAAPLLVAESPELFYGLPLDDKERRIISSIITTMAEKNIIQLALEKGSLEKKGKKIDQVHPLRFMGYIMSTSELRSAAKQIKKSSFKWDAFIGGFKRRMNEEQARNNVMQYVPGFAQQVGAPSADVAEYIKERDYEGLVKFLMR